MTEIPPEMIPGYVDKLKARLNSVLEGLERTRKEIRGLKDEVNSKKISSADAGKKLIKLGTDLLSFNKQQTDIRKELYRYGTA
jgi:predicted  nucleic acid-binding Zn-ribbon protein